MMNTNEWPLIFFTLLSQVSVGLILSGLVLAVSLKNADLEAHNELKRSMLTLAMITMGVALIISFFHLTNPFHSVYALSNMGSSYLSREILLAALYFFTLVVAYTSVRFEVPAQGTFPFLYIGSAFIGLLYIWVMSRLYMIPIAPFWDSPATPVAFYASAVTLGASLMLVLVVYLNEKGVSVEPMKGVSTVLFILAAVGVFTHLFNTLLLQPDLSDTIGSFAAPTIHHFWKTSWFILILAGFSLLTWWFSVQVSIQEVVVQPRLVFWAFLLLLLAEIGGRYIFYASYYRVGV